jgi:glycosyltransferase involved in cell wall biosynthesis
MLVGEGSDFEANKALVKEYCKDHIIFTGQQKNIESLINVFDIGILLTNTSRHQEGISNSILEYMALSKPVIATDGGGTGEIVNHEHTGFIIPPANLESLLNAIHSLLEDPSKASKMGQQGKERISEEFSIEHMVNGTVEL